VATNLAFCHDKVQRRMIYIGAFVAFIGLVFVYEMIRPTYFWLAAKVMGWSHHEQFMRETARLGRPRPPYRRSHFVLVSDYATARSAFDEAVRRRPKLTRSSRARVPSRWLPSKL
jgi:hypothetical protein